MSLARDTYSATERFPARETYELARQMRGSAVSIPSNVAEGAGRDSPGGFRRFLRIAYGSACELETQASLAHDLAFADSDSLARLASEAERGAKTALRADRAYPNREPIADNRGPQPMAKRLVRAEPLH